MEHQQSNQEESLDPTQVLAKASILAECEKLAAAGVTFVAVHFDGYGDSGVTEEAQCFDSDEYIHDDSRPIKHDVSHLQQHFEALVPFGYENDCGGEELSLTASAGVAPNKFLAKLASDWRKPDGLFVIQPENIDTFLLLLSVGRLPGVGRVTGEKLAKLGAQTVRDLRTLDVAVLEQHFGRYGQRLHQLARGIDDNQVVPDRPTQSISVEDTFEHDVLLAETEAMIRRLAEKLWSASRKESRMARTVVLKLKTSEFKILTRSHTPGSPPSSYEELTDIALKLRERVDLGQQQRYRLVGVGLSV
jgi:impB/mucB/samB family C-terminal domain